MKKNVQKKETHYGCGRKKNSFVYMASAECRLLWQTSYYYYYICRLRGSDVSSYVHMYINLIGTSQIPFSPHCDDVTSTHIIMNNNTPSPSVCIYVYISWIILRTYPLCTHTYWTILWRIRLSLNMKTANVRNKY